MTVEEYLRQHYLKPHLFDLLVELTYTGKGLSLNDFYSSGHWHSRKQKVDKYKALMWNMITSKPEMRFIDKFMLVIRYNSQHDVDNVVGMEKVFMDALKPHKDKEDYENYIREDDKRYYKGMLIFPDVSLPHNTFVFALFEKNGYKK